LQKNIEQLFFRDRGNAGGRRRDFAAADSRDVIDAICLQDFLNALRCVTFVMQKAADAFEKIDILTAVKTPSARTAHRSHLTEHLFPMPQNVLRDADFLAGL
jgi:hypothetical protein